MLGLGAATRYAILRAQGDERSERYFSNALLWALVFALPFMLAGIFCPEVLLRFMGGDAEIVALGVGYARIFLLFTPSSCATTSSRLLSGTTAIPHWPWWRPSAAASSTWCSITSSCSPWVSVCPARRWRRGLAGVEHCDLQPPLLQKSSTVRLVRQLPSPKLLAQSCQLGVSGFVGEMSSGVTTTVFNLLLLRLAGNVAVAAYASWRTTRWWRRQSSTAWPRRIGRWSAGATAKTMPPVPASSCCWAAEQRLRWRRHCMQFCSGSPGRSSRSSTVRTRPHGAVCL